VPRRVSQITLALAALAVAPTLSACGSGGGKSPTNLLSEVRRLPNGVVIGPPTEHRGKLVGPRRIQPGSQITVHGSGFPPDTPLTLGAVPRAYVRSNGVGTLIHSYPKTDANGTFSASFVFPGTYSSGGGSFSRRIKWEPGMPVRLGVSRFGASLPVVIAGPSSD
jgi:hypothetical protein